MAKGEIIVSLVNVHFIPLTMYINVVKEGFPLSKLAASGILYVKKLQTICIPLVDDQVFLWNDEDDEGPQWYVKKRYMRNDGSWEIELSKMIIDPSESDLDVIRNNISRGSFTYYPWYTNSDGVDPEESLVRFGGWKKYEGNSN